MKAMLHEITTALPLSEVAQLFRSCIESPRGFMAKQLVWSFSTPEHASDPFADVLPPDREPAFEVVAEYRLRDKRTLTSGQREMYGQFQGASGGALTLSVFDDYGLRRCQIRHDGALSPASRSAAKQILAAMRKADPDAKITSSKVRL